MSNNCSMGLFALTSSQAAAVHHIETQALQTIDNTFTTGYPQYRKGTSGLAFHNGYHARSVGKAARRLAEAVGLTPAEQATCQLAGYAHDLVQKHGSGTNEHLSAQWLAGQIAQLRLPTAMAEVCTLAILGTEPTLSGGLLTGQKATQQRYPSRSAELVARCVASADLGELFTPMGPYLSHQLFAEFQRVMPGSTPDTAGLLQFAQNQLRLLQSYRYPLPQAERLLATHRQQVIKYTQQVAQQLEHNPLPWAQLIRQDLAFARAC